ncbi:phosphoribosylglycinamide formyltransferase [Photobacterium aquae]|uniref:Phosphoribosylglycinamide formyltransferase n=1 Tax=Photobacterium aquae TaxID=1195763 RepID=A0A0J1JXB8_9GAMM|nr:phosphoribosylglycinamide formyltransferase [Photobacterium aquae]KLV06937.1 phosphoribosylglycinamide formyltransferase [Photobacterium aquae]
MIPKSLFRTCFVLLCVLGRGPVANASIPQFTDSDIEHPSPIQGSKDKFQHSLSGLYAIPSAAAHELKQPYADFDTLYSKGEVAQAELKQLLTQISLHTDTKPILPGIKSKQRAKFKVDTELNGHADKLTDLARGSLIAKDIPSLIDAFELLGHEATIIETKNRFKSPAPSGYRDLKVLISLTNSQIIAEVQLHLETIAEIKNGPEHEIYETIQQLERLAIAEERELNEFELARIKQLRSTSLTMYQHAWHHYLQPSGLTAQAS